MQVSACGQFYVQFFLQPLFYGFSQTLVAMETFGAVTGLVTNFNKSSAHPIRCEDLDLQYSTYLNLSREPAKISHPLSWPSAAYPLKLATGNSPSGVGSPSPSPRGTKFTHPRPREHCRGEFFPRPRPRAGNLSPRGSPSPLHRVR